MDSEDFFLRFDEWAGKIQERVDQNKGMVEAVNGMMVVAAFIAGVQAQIISFTKELPQSALGRAANFFAFVGLMLDIAGTFLGALHALSLQRKIKAEAGVISSVTQCKADLRIIVKAIRQEEEKKQQDDRAASNRGADGSMSNFHLFTGASNVVFSGSLNVSSVNQVPLLRDEVNDYQQRASNVRLFLRNLDEHSKQLAPTYMIDKIQQLVDRVLQAKPLRVNPAQSPQPTRPQARARLTWSLANVAPTLRPVFQYGSTPLISMAAGVACLAITTILLPAGSQEFRRESWVGSVAVLVGVVALAGLPSTSVLKLFDKFGSEQQGRHLVDSPVEA